ncbi:MAG: ATP-dependent DNA helicase RecG [Candidatus Omnitrophica bacterium]|nr:ATP-dependent DNA helicase RecG [Candidatus Omnitrophota bacterium]MDD5352716.1 ATP-dependent DNA helicase RecG [Candidatus Omnitrophota bacterium]MDD5550315.1 ATP-dependent DNA helicase RecG [Candidatus Omnitrophota bacterium]
MNSLSDSLQYFKGVGPKKIKLFKKLGILSIEDLFYYFPRRYEDRSNFVNISQIEIGKSYTIKGQVLATGGRRSWRRRGFSIVEVAVGDKSGRIFAVWFNQPYLKQYFKVGQDIILYGKVELYKDRLQISNPEFEILDNKDSDSLSTGRIVPIYSACEGLTQRFMRQLIKNALDKYISKTRDPLPYDIRKRHSLLNLAQSLINIHFPKDDGSKTEAYRRLSFEEFFLFQIPVVLRKLKKKEKRGIIHKAGGVIFSKLIKSLPFSLTAAQERVVDEIKTDMSREYPMQRLLQGEVGSGKTVVATLAAVIALDGGYQVAFMVPTEILAKQHFVNIKNQLAKISTTIETVLLTSDIKKKEKEGIYKKISSGQFQLIIGTHALIQESLTFKKLGLVIIDEQHKFGVAQRALLPKKGNNPDVLIMTATPIPRTLSMTIYGDLDISVIDELPKERLPIKTSSYGRDKMGEIYEFVRNIARQKRQVYFVCPVIEEFQEEDLKAAEIIFKEFKNETFKDFKVGLVHGQMPSDAADKVMQDFKNGDIDILVATSVLEVGIDIPNAICMVVLQAECFGLSQLHQLRGRIGRGQFESFFIVVSEPKTDEAKRRIKAIEELSNGFKIAEEDLKIRGPGEFFGKRQHGLTALKIANPLTQMRLLKNARDEVITLLRNDPNLSQRQNLQLLAKIKTVFPQFPRLDITA